MKYFIYSLNAVIKVLTGTEPCCRFQISCSRHFLNCLEQQGLVKGSISGVKRILQCQPFGKHYE
jgi:putative component of membrane protein insertase Oxa1/YidC/SpoIIIJ protein YidD